MGIFGKLFKSKKLRTTDKDFGEIESFSTNGNRIGWQINRKFLNSSIEILIEGTQNSINENQKQILLNALNNETEIISEVQKALKEQFENAEMEFVSIDKHFKLKGISVRDDGFEMVLQEKEGQNYFFNIQFENNKQVGVSIDG
ncbi:hypothetical protein LCGC14_1447870 [marine sediment metagenome]|jgi:hypothetical protein|uniref:DUF2262 domain-containing protein n=1 Tax=marine sediment metagenome TaxID=412755 RepID=A0A0F9K4Y1_9ZZZZ|nr:hypothetical protein [Pricia sp.]|tara:strand:+ start:10798 stop:11229 length:432 start_codon:yes stop_codon:yes gene_type:complete